MNFNKFDGSSKNYPLNEKIVIKKIKGMGPKQRCS